MILLSLVLAMSGPAIAAQTPGEVFAGLIGSCYQGAYGADASETHCFTLSADGKLVTDIHKVHASTGAVTYFGVSIYRTSAEGRDLVYNDLDSFGTATAGHAWRENHNRIASFRGDYEAGLPSLWSLSGDGYDVWALKPVHFRRTGPAD